MINNQSSLMLAVQINKLRRLMILNAKIYGLGSQETLYYSEQLDELILQYQFQNRCSS